MADHVYHWKHGWIPINSEAADVKAHGEKVGANRVLTTSEVAKVAAGEKSAASAKQALTHSSGYKGKSVADMTPNQKKYALTNAKSSLKNTTPGSSEESSTKAFIAQLEGGGTSAPKKVASPKKSAGPKAGPPVKAAGIPEHKLLKKGNDWEVYTTDHQHVGKVVTNPSGKTYSVQYANGGSISKAKWSTPEDAAANLFDPDRIAKNGFDKKILGDATPKNFPEPMKPNASAPAAKPFKPFGEVSSKFNVVSAGASPGSASGDGFFSIHDSKNGMKIGGLVVAGGNYKVSGPDGVFLKPESSFPSKEEALTALDKHINPSKLKLLKTHDDAKGQDFNVMDESGKNVGVMVKVGDNVVVYGANNKLLKPENKFKSLEEATAALEKSLGGGPTNLKGHFHGGEGVVPEKPELDPEGRLTGNDALRAAPLRSGYQHALVTGEEGLGYYKGSGYHNMNGALRTNKGDLSKIHNEKIKAYIGQVDKVFAESPGLAHDIKTYRGFGHDGLPSKNMTGAEFVDHAFISTSVNKSTTSGFASDEILMEITIPKGAKGIALDTPGSGGYYNGEGEVLLNRGTKFHVISDSTSSNGHRTLRVEVVK
jgi:hypothetical protein